MKKYALLDNEGYVVSVGQGPEIPEGCVECGDIPASPGPNMWFHFSDGAWKDKRSEQQKLNDEIKKVRIKRKLLLDSTDWVIVKSLDRGEPVPQEWKDYRQSLRDITLQGGFPFDIVWPVKPSS